jgi:hypothetical protein
MQTPWIRFLVSTLVCAVVAPAAYAQSDPILAAYASCTFADGLQIVQIDSLAAGITSRQVQTDNGVRQIDLEAGLRIMFAYPDTDFYANVKAERLPATRFQGLRQALLDNFDFMAHGNTVNTSLKSPMNGFEIKGLDREKLEGGVLGVYLLFDTQDHTATTIYLLNQEPEARKFQTIDEYRALRDRFLTSYTSCIRSNQATRK